jgi:hypothetical protein
MAEVDEISELIGMVVDAYEEVGGKGKKKV